MKRIIVTTADETYADLLDDLLDSLADVEVALPFDIGVLDVGLSAESRERVSQRADFIVQPDWDGPVDAALRIDKPYLRSSTARLQLRKYFPGYDTYLWLDSDLWVQGGWAIDMFFREAERVGMAMAPHAHPAYRVHPTRGQWVRDRYVGGFGTEHLDELMKSPSFNNGVLAITHDAPHWGPWSDAYLRALTSPGVVQVESQTALNYALVTEGLPIATMPATANWLCHLAMPRLNLATGTLCEPIPPHDALGIIHFSGPNKRPSWNVVKGDESIQLSLTYRRIIEFRRRANGNLNN